MILKDQICIHCKNVFKRKKFSNSKVCDDCKEKGLTDIKIEKYCIHCKSVCMTLPNISNDMIICDDCRNKGLKPKPKTKKVICCVCGNETDVNIRASNNHSVCQSCKNKKKYNFKEIKKEIQQPIIKPKTKPIKKNIPKQQKIFKNQNDIIPIIPINNTYIDNHDYKNELQKLIFELFYNPSNTINDKVKCDSNILGDEYKIDVYVPSLKIGIDLDDFTTDNKNFEKYDIGHNNKIRMIQIFKDEWIYKKNIVISRLKQILNINEAKRIHARKCIIREIEPSIKNIFLDTYHIQGKDSTTIKLGAFYNNQLVSVMTFGKGNISKGSKNKKNIWELNRFCSDSKYHIPGIASKLLKYFQKNFEWNEIFSYADLRWSDGNVYEKIGFDFLHQTQKNYWYINTNLTGVNKYKRIHRFNLRKKPDEPKELTERFLRAQAGYIRIYDCGNLKYGIIK